jgi:mannose-6-phosphate isomerase-like protein (cupin superfamily)
MNIVSRSHPLTHYLWGEQCDGWNLVDTPELSVKMERMPPHTAEQEHFHQYARQFFFILKGWATFFLAGEAVAFAATGEQSEQQVELNPQEGLEIRPGLRHRIENNGDEDLEFILCSQPSTKDDRYPTMNQ